MMKSSRLVLALLAATTTMAASGQAPVVETIDVATWPRLWDKRVAMPWFDGQNRLQWNDEPVLAAGGCDGSWFPEAGGWTPRCERRAVMVAPRVDECRCTGVMEGDVRSGVAYAGLDAHHREQWRRLQRSPRQAEAPSLKGAGPTGLVFGNLEIWSPVSGETIHAGNGTTAPEAACYLPEQNGFLLFDAEVALFKSRGGLWLEAGGRRELVLPVETKLSGYYIIESITVVPGTSRVLLGERYSTRGPGSARFELFDLASRRVLFSERRAVDHYVSEVRVTAGREGHVAFSFLDESAGKYEVVRYRVR